MARPPITRWNGVLFQRQMDAALDYLESLGGGGGGGIADGDKGDITVSSSGSVWTVDAVPWTNVTGKPSTFTPATHSHAISDVTGLQAALDGKQASGSYAASTHTHAISDTTGLQAALDGKQATLVSATNIKTINGASILGSGDLTVSGSGASAASKWVI